MSDLEPLSPDLAKLFAEERATHAENAARRAAVLRRLGTAIAIGGAEIASSIVSPAPGSLGAPHASAPPGAPNGGTTPHVASPAPAVGANAVATSAKVAIGVIQKKILVATVAGALGGLAVGETHRALAPVAPAPAMSQHVPSATQPALSTTQPGAITPVANESPSAIFASDLPVAHTADHPTSPSAAASTSAARSTLADEQALIDRARSALLRQRSDDALAAANEHAQRFPQGKLVEDRDMLIVQALLANGDHKGAESRAASFKRTYPKSIYIPAIERMLSERKPSP